MPLIASESCISKMKPTHLKNWFQQIPRDYKIFTFTGRLFFNPINAVPWEMHRPPGNNGNSKASNLGKDMESLGVSLSVPLFSLGFAMPFLIAWESCILKMKPTHLKYLQSQAKVVGKVVQLNSSPF